MRAEILDGVAAMPEGKRRDSFAAQVGATALAAVTSTAMRDVGGFAGCGLTIIDPWA